MMPSTSKKQHNFMEAVAHNPEFAKKAGVPQSVGKDFSKADKGKTFKRGGDMATNKMGKPMMKPGMSMAKDGMKRPTPMADTSMSGVGMKKGGLPMVMKDGKKVPAFAADGKGKMNMGGKVKKMSMGGMAYAKGGGIESKGKTKGKIIKMAGGGSSKKYC
jgi:hypothetical protein